MTMLCTTHPDETAARAALETFRNTGARARDIRLLIGRGCGDVRRRPVGGFGGRVGPDAPVGTYAHGPIARRRGSGSFAGGSEHRRQGAFCDTDRVLIVPDPDDIAHARVTGVQGARRLLARAALDPDEQRHALEQLELGHTIMLAETDQTAAAPVAAPLERTAHAA